MEGIAVGMMMVLEENVRENAYKRRVVKVILGGNFIDCAVREIFETC